MKKAIIFTLVFILFSTPFVLADNQPTTLSQYQIHKQMNDADLKIATGVLMIVGGSLIDVVDFAYLLLQIYDTRPQPVPVSDPGQPTEKKYTISTETEIWMTVFGIVGTGLLALGINNCAMGGEEKDRLKKQMSLMPFIYPDNVKDKYTYGLKMNLEF